MLAARCVEPPPAFVDCTLKLCSGMMYGGGESVSVYETREGW